MNNHPTTESGCVFCLIAEGTASPMPEVLCEANAWVAFSPLEPATPGHTLVIPRVHGPDLWTLERHIARELMSAVQLVGNAIKAALSPDGMNLITSSGSAAEQTVFHAHLHLVPRWQDDGFGRIWPSDGQVSDRVETYAVERIRAACRT